MADSITIGLKPYVEAMHDRELERLKDENAKLRELVRHVLVLRHDPAYRWLDASSADIFGRSFTDLANDLGIEVQP